MPKKNYILIISSLLLLYYISFCQKLTERSLDDELASIYSKILYYIEEGETVYYPKHDDLDDKAKSELSNKYSDSLEYFNDLFNDRIKFYTSNYPQTLDFSFDSLKQKIDIITSDDILLRIYSWDTWLGGTQHNFRNVFQYKSGNKVLSKTATDFDPRADESGDWYSEIFTLIANDKVYYLSIGNAIGSTKDAGQTLNVFCIENDSLINNVKLFEPNKGYRSWHEVDTNRITIWFDFFSVVDRPERPVKLIDYDPAKKIITIPIITDQGAVTNKFIRYKFNGKYFVRVK